MINISSIIRQSNRLVITLIIIIIIMYKRSFRVCVMTYFPEFESKSDFSRHTGVSINISTKYPQAD